MSVRTRRGRGVSDLARAPLCVGGGARVLAAQPVALGAQRCVPSFASALRRLRRVALRERLRLSRLGDGEHLGLGIVRGARLRVRRVHLLGHHRGVRRDRRLHLPPHGPCCAERIVLRAKGIVLLAELLERRDRRGARLAASAIAACAIAAAASRALLAAATPPAASRARLRMRGRLPGGVRVGGRDARPIWRRRGRLWWRRDRPAACASTASASSWRRSCSSCSTNPASRRPTRPAVPAPALVLRRAALGLVSIMRELGVGSATLVARRAHEASEARASAALASASAARASSAACVPPPLRVDRFDRREPLGGRRLCLSDRNAE